MEAYQTFTREQRAGANYPYEIDASALAVGEWAPNAFVAASAFCRPTRGNETGFVYQQSAAAGQSGKAEPSWPTAAASTIADGSLTWTALAPPADGQDEIGSVAWTQTDPPDAELTITDEEHDALTATAQVGGGTPGNVYTVVASVTMASGLVYPIVYLITIL